MMRDENDRRTARVRGDGGQADQEPFPGSEIEAGKRLVEEEEFRIAHERPGQQHLLALPL